MGLSDSIRANFAENGFPVRERIESLKRLYNEISYRSGDIAAAIKKDFNKSAFDCYATEIGLTLHEIRLAIKHLKKWAKPKRVGTSIINFPSKGYIYPEPYGAVLIIAPWNYPFQLSMVPLVGAVAAGNYVALKPSSKTKATAEIIREIVEKSFSGGTVVYTDARDTLDERWDYIFFTGSTGFGKKVLHAAAEHVTPVTLELGGKSPCIIDKDADIKRAAKRIAYGKFLNAGQTCIAPDYIMLHNSVKEAFTDAFISEIELQYYDQELNLSKDFPYVINDEKAAEVEQLIKSDKLLFGGRRDGWLLEPTVIESSFSSPIMRDEIFAPIAPLIGFDDINEVVTHLKSSEKPLALYYFGKNYKALERVSFGGGCVNDVLMHITESKLPFGGVGYSGMGSYHGKKSFDTFTHYKGVLFKGKGELPVKYAPHDKKDESILKAFLK